MNIQTEIQTRDLKWLPPFLLKNMAGGRLEYTGSFSKSERQIMRKRKKIRPSKWAPQNRVITLGKLQGPWRNEVTPYLAPIMDAMALPYVRTIIISAANQIGKSEVVHTFVGWCIDHNPGPVQYNYPDRLTGSENCKDRIIPMIESSPRLRGYLTGYDDDKTSLRVKLSHMPIYIGWAGSESRAENRPIKIMIFDETDLYQTKANQTDYIDRGEKRCITYQHDHKIIKLSKPRFEHDPISMALLGKPDEDPPKAPEAQVVFDYYVKCPGCGEYHLMTDENIQWEKEPDGKGGARDPDPERMESQNLAWYDPPCCGMLWNDNLRNRAALDGEMQSRRRDQGEKVEGGIEMFKYLDKHRPRKIGFNLPSWISSFMGLSKVAAAKIRAMADPKKEQDYENAHRARAYRKVAIVTNKEKILSAKCALPAQTVPDDALALTCGIDVQKRGFWFAVRAWAFDYTSWLIHYGTIPLWEDVEELLFKTLYPSEDGARHYRVFRAAVDTGGGEGEGSLSMTEETYWWIRRNGIGRGCRVWGTKGAQQTPCKQADGGQTLGPDPQRKADARRHPDYFRGYAPGQKCLALLQPACRRAASPGGLPSCGYRGRFRKAYPGRGKGNRSQGRGALGAKAAG